jgi:hypothetical protein
MDSSAYQLRFDLLVMAKELLMEEWFAKRQAQERQFEENVRHSERVPRPGGPLQYPELPDAPTDEKIMKLAAELNSFVSRKF